LLQAVHAQLRPGACVAIAGDITSAEHRSALAEAAREVGGLDAVVNNAGVLGPSPLPRLLDYPLHELELVLRVNVVAQLGVLQAVHAQLRPGACVVNVTSDAAVTAYSGWGGYGASKAALEQLSSVLAVENPELRVYSVDPGDLRTDMHQAAYPGEDISDRAWPSERVPALIALIDSDLPSGRYVAADLSVRDLPGDGYVAAELSVGGRASV
jgi:NAD(P)-dependent dehydrogenase (short-subunit alcohol dehydrogenase family)